jgi:hypothetical protein
MKKIKLEEVGTMWTPGKIIVAVVGLFFIANLIAFSSSRGMKKRAFRLFIRDLIQANIFILSMLSFVALAFWLFKR